MLKTIRRDLDDSPDGHDHHTEKDSLLTTKSLTDGKSNYSAEEAPYIVNSSYRSEETGLRLTNEVVKLEKVLSDNYAAY